MDKGIDNQGSGITGFMSEYGATVVGVLLIAYAVATGLMAGDNANVPLLLLFGLLGLGLIGWGVYRRRGAHTR